VIRQPSSSRWRCAASAAARAERLTIALSTTDIAISSAFTGAPVTLFGVIEGDEAAAAPADTNYQVAVLILGPRHSVVARKKDLFLGVWANRESQTIINPPSFYSLSTSAARNPRRQQRLRRRGPGGGQRSAAAEFRAAFIRLKENAALTTRRSA
jgi:uncharacterized protein (TIGR02186 family)